MKDNFVKQRGMILITVFIFLTILSASVLFSIESSILQSKVVQIQRLQQRLFWQGQQALVEGEQSLQSNCILPNKCIKVKMIETMPCINDERQHIDLYLITVMIKQKALHINLQSTYLNANQCKGIKSGRQSWRQL